MKAPLLLLLPLALALPCRADEAALTARLQKEVRDWLPDRARAEAAVESRADRARVKEQFDAADKLVAGCRVERGPDGKYRLLRGTPEGKSLVARAGLADEAAAEQAIPSTGKALGEAAKEALPLIRTLAGATSMAHGWTDSSLPGQGFEPLDGESLEQYRRRFVRQLLPRFETPPSADQDERIAHLYERQGMVDAQESGWEERIKLDMLPEVAKHRARLQKKAGVSLSEADFDRFVSEEWTYGQGDVSESARKCAARYRIGVWASIEDCVAGTLKQWASKR